jgi:hypothetical protein
VPVLVLGQRGVQQFAGAPEIHGRQPRRPVLRPESLEGVPESGVGERALRERLCVGVDRARTEHPLHEPAHRTSDPALQRGRRPDVLAQPGKDRLGAQRPERTGARDRRRRIVGRTERPPLA